MLKTAQIRDMTDDELRQRMEGLRKELFDLRTQVRAGRVEKPHKISLARKDMARILTILNERKSK